MLGLTLAITIIIDIANVSNRNDIHIQGLYFPPVCVALMPADISSSTIVSMFVFCLGRVSDGSGEGLLKSLREFAFET